MKRSFVSLNDSGFRSRDRQVGATRETPLNAGYQAQVWLGAEMALSNQGRHKRPDQA
jgi:hypothetical protein